MTIFSGRASRAWLFLPILLMSVRGFAQDAADQNAEQQQSVPPATDADKTQAKPDQPKTDAEAPPDKRVLGVLPNYRTINETGVYTPITAKQKMIIASKDSFDYPLVILSGLFAGLSQLENSSPSFGQGVKGYAHRLATNYADQAIGNMLTEGFLPALLHEDPRYRRLGASRGSIKYRTWYAASRIFVTRTDSGGTRFNYSEWVGNSIGTGISNAYYPDNRTWGDNLTKLMTQCGTDALSQVLKEFWPDVKHKFFQKKTAGSD